MYHLPIEYRQDESLPSLHLGYPDSFVISILHI